jgi:hypothetical protein
VIEYRCQPDRLFLNYFFLRISETRKDMNRDIVAWSDRMECRVTHDPGTAGFLQPTPTRMFPGGESKYQQWNGAVFATMFLNAADLRALGDEIVAHESTHCALAFERYVRRFNMDFGLEAGDEEEPFCYSLGRIVKAVKEAVKEYTRLRAKRPTGRKGKA